MADKNVVLARPHIPKAETRIPDAKEAVLDFARQLEGPVLGGVLFFCSTAYDLDVLGPALKAAFDCPVFGCTSAGEIGRRYQTGGLIGVGLPASLFKIHVSPHISLKEFPSSLNDTLAKLSGHLEQRQHAGFLVFDGLSQHSEQVLTIKDRVGTLQISGAAAGDATIMNNGYVYSDGQFLRDAAVLMIMESGLRSECFSFSHDTPGNRIKTGDAEDYIASLKQKIDALRANIPDILFTIGFESNARRQFIEGSGITQKIEQLLTPLNFTGLSTYQELSNGSIKSETLSGVAFGVMD